MPGAPIREVPCEAKVWAGWEIRQAGGARSKARIKAGGRATGRVRRSKGKGLAFGLEAGGRSTGETPTRARSQSSGVRSIDRSINPIVGDRSISGSRACSGKGGAGASPVGSSLASASAIFQTIPARSCFPLSGMAWSTGRRWLRFAICYRLTQPTIPSITSPVEAPIWRPSSREVSLEIYEDARNRQ